MQVAVDESTPVGLVAAEQRLGRVRGDIDPQEVAGLLLGVLFALGTMPAIGDEGLNPDRVASAVRLMVRGIQPAVRVGQE